MTCEVWLNYDGLRLLRHNYQSRGEGQGDTETEGGKCIQTNIIIQTDRPTVIDTTHLSSLGFIRRIIQSEFLREK